MSHSEMDRVGGNGVASAGSGDTIVALASGAGISAVAIIRISGPSTRMVLENLIGHLPEPRVATLRAIGSIDRGLVIWFPGPASFSGEDMAEFQVHGGHAVVRALVDVALSFSGMRLAEPGEFTRRAFENGKLDLTEVEGLADLISAETEAQRRQAHAQAEGGLRRLYDNWRGELLTAQSVTEAGLDFSDEGDVAEDAFDQGRMSAQALLEAVEDHLSAHGGERLREGFRVVIAGAPNAGKSSLLNALAKRDVAIVSHEAGTTRDIIEVHLDLGGLAIILADTAGIREGTAGVEREGIERAVSRAKMADLILWVIDGAAPTIDLPSSLRDRAMLLALNKADLDPDLLHTETGAPMVAVSSKTGDGIPALLAHLHDAASADLGSLSASPITRSRHREELVSVRDALKRFVNHDLEPELGAEELRLASHHLGRLTGRIDVEDVLGGVFSGFCIGK